MFYTVYMRVLRRISDDCSLGEKTSRDIDVRKKLRAPSIDSLLMRGRPPLPRSDCQGYTARPDGVTFRRAKR